MGKLGQTISRYWTKIQAELFPQLEETLDPLSEKHQQLIAILELIRIEQYIPSYRWYVGRPRKTRDAIARSFVAKMVYNISSTRMLYDRLHSDIQLRRICGWENRKHVPSESTFSRAFGEFARSLLPQKVHEVLIKKSYKETETIVVHNSRDATAIEGREKPVVKKIRGLAGQSDAKPIKKRGRPKRGDENPAREQTRTEKQLTMSLKEMLADLPKYCDVGTKKNSKGHCEHWIGYKLHLDWADGAVPLSAILTSASVHDSQVAIPLATMTADRVRNLYDLMDAAYDTSIIREHSRALGHVPLIDINPRRNKALADELKAEARRQKLIGLEAPEKLRYNERTTAERGNARLKDEFGGRMVRVRGHVKVMCHLMFGVLALAADQILKLVT